MTFQTPIKGAIVMSRQIPEEHVDGAYQRANEICRFLKSLPEAENMPICVILDYKDSSITGYNPRQAHYSDQDCCTKITIIQAD